MRDRQKGVWQMSLAMLISGSIGALVLLSGLPVIDVVFWRCVIGAITLLIFIVLSRSSMPVVSRSAWLLAAGGGIALVLNWLLLFAAYSRISIGLATVVYNTQPFMLVLMSLLLGERVTREKWGWLAMAFCGVVLLLLSDITQTADSNGLMGMAMALGAAFFYAITALVARQLHPIPPQYIAFIQVLVGMLMLSPLTHFSAVTAQFPWSILLTLGIVHTGIMFQLLYSALQKLPTPLIGSLSFIYPLVALLVDNVLFGHTPTATQSLGGVLILFAAAGNNLGWAAWLRAKNQQRRFLIIKKPH